MPYYLATQLIKAPRRLTETNNTQYAEQKTLEGGVGRDYFGSNKRIWTLEYNNTKKDDYFTIKAIYNTYLDTGDAIEWEITEDNYFINETLVHIDLVEREFSVGGSNYISDFVVTLTEA